MDEHNIEKLRWRCFQIIPLVFDEALSYYEVVSKGAKKTNEIIDYINELSGALSELEGDVGDLSTTVGNISDTIVTLSNEVGTNTIALNNLTNKKNYAIFSGEMDWGNISVSPSGLQYRIPDYSLVNVQTDHSNTDGGVLCSVTYLSNGSYAIRGVGCGALLTGEGGQELIYVWMTYDPINDKFVRNQSFKPDDREEDPQGELIHAKVVKILGVY